MNVGPAIGDGSAAAIRIHRYAVDTDTPNRAATAVTASPRFLTVRISSLRSSSSRMTAVNLLDKPANGNVAMACGSVVAASAES